MEALTFSKHLFLTALVIYIVYTVYRFQRDWVGEEYYRATMLKLDSRKTVVSFGFLFLGTLLSTMGAFAVGFEMERYVLLLFDFSIVSWAVFFYMINQIISKGGGE